MARFWRLPAVLVFTTAAEHWDWRNRIPGGPCFGHIIGLVFPSKPGFSEASTGSADKVLLHPRHALPHLSDAHARPDAEFMTNLVALPAGTELVSDYRIERALGAGGFGITYLAEEKPLKRLVTIKEFFPVDFAARDPKEDVCPRSRDSESDYKWGLERFIEEAQTLAKFNHPNIVGVHRYFLARNTGYIVLHFEEGQSFKGWLKGLGRAPRQPELDRILAPLLDALEYIHNADFLHRDIAPDNIIIRKDGSPVLIDFGSARGEIAQHTKTISALVKPGYSPYEQYASTSRQQGPWTDIYSLGATLYQAVTGKRPPDAPSRMVADEMVPVKNAALSSYRPGFLAAIDHALALDVNARPRSIARWRAELMAPAGRFGRKAAEAAHAPVEAVALVPIAAPLPPPMVPAVPAGARTGRGGVIASFVDGWRKAAPEAAPIAPTAVVLQVQAGPPVNALKPVAQSKALVVRPEPGSRAATPRAIRARRVHWRPVAVKLGIGLVLAGVIVAKQDQLQELLPKAHSEGSGTVLSQSGDTVPVGQLKGHRGAVNAVGFGAEGRLIVSAGADATIKVWSATTRALQRTIELEHGGPSAMAVEGRRAVTGHKDGTVALWDIETGARIATFRRNEASIWSVAFAGEAGRVVASGHDWAVTVWDAKAPAAPVHVLEGHESAAQAVAYSGTGGHIASGGADKTVKLWKADGGALLRTYRGHGDFVTALAFTPDGRRLASAALDGQIRIWSTLTSRLHVTLRGHQGRVAALSFSPDGELLASASDDGSVRLWDVKRGRSMRTLQSHTGEIRTVSFAPDGRRIAAAGNDGLVRLWSAVIPKPGS